MNEVPWIQKLLSEEDPERIVQVERIVHGMRLLAISAQRDLSPSADPPKGQALAEFTRAWQLRGLMSLHVLLGKTLEAWLPEDSCVYFARTDAALDASWKTLAQYVGSEAVARLTRQTILAQFSGLLRWGRGLGLCAEWVELWRIRSNCVRLGAQLGCDGLRKLLAKKIGSGLQAEVRLDLAGWALQAGHWVETQGHLAWVLRQGNRDQRMRARWLLQWGLWTVGETTRVTGPMCCHPWPDSGPESAPWRAQVVRPGLSTSVRRGIRVGGESGHRSTRGLLGDSNMWKGNPMEWDGFQGAALVEVTGCGAWTGRWTWEPGSETSEMQHGTGSLAIQTEVAALEVESARATRRAHASGRWEVVYLEAHPRAPDEQREIEGKRSTENRGGGPIRAFAVWPLRNKVGRTLALVRWFWRHEYLPAEGQLERAGRRIALENWGSPAQLGGGAGRADSSEGKLSVVHWLQEVHKEMPAHGWQVWRWHRNRWRQAATRSDYALEVPRLASLCAEREVLLWRAIQTGEVVPAESEVASRVHSNSNQPGEPAVSRVPTLRRDELRTESVETWVFPATWMGRPVAVLEADVQRKPEGAEAYESEQAGLAWLYFEFLDQSRQRKLRPSVDLPIWSPSFLTFFRGIQRCLESGGVPLLVGARGSGVKSLKRWLEYLLTHGEMELPKGIAPLIRQIRTPCPGPSLREQVRKVAASGLPVQVFQVPDLVMRRTEILDFLRRWTESADQEYPWIHDDAVCAALWRQPWQGQVAELREVWGALCMEPPNGTTLEGVRKVLVQRGLPWVDRLASKAPDPADVLSALNSTRTQAGRYNKRRAALYLGWDPDTLAMRLKDFGWESTGPPAWDPWGTSHGPPGGGLGIGNTVVVS